MPRIELTPNLSRQTEVAARDVSGATVREALESFFSEYPKARSYLLDDQGAVRQHVTLFVDGVSITDRNALTDPVEPDSVIFVMQALSGG